MVLYPHCSGDTGRHARRPQSLLGLTERDLREVLRCGVRDLRPDPCPSISSLGSLCCIINCGRYVVGTGEKLAVGV